MHMPRAPLTLLTTSILAALFLAGRVGLAQQPQGTPTQEPAASPSPLPTPPPTTTPSTTQTPTPTTTATTPTTLDNQPPTFRTGTELVTVDVGVVDRQGQPVRGLAGTDFTVTVANRPRRIVSVEYVDTSTAPPALLAKAPNADVISTNEGSGVGRLIVFVVDQNSLEPGSVHQMAGSAGRFFERLTFADRSALLLMPVGPNVAFTWNHDRVRDGLARVSGLAGFAPEWSGGSLSDARDVAVHGAIALRGIADRECGGTLIAGGGGFGQGGGSQPAPTPVPAPGGGGGGGGGEGGQPGGGSSGSGGSSGGSGRGTGGAGAGSRGREFGVDRCSDRIRMEAESTWRQAHMNSLSSLAALRQVLARLAQVRGDKTVVFISGGMPLDERDDLTLLSSVAKEAVEARTTFFTIFIPSSPTSAARSRLVARSVADEQIHRWPLETIAELTGGSSHRADVGADAVFGRLARELSGYYRLGIERVSSDVNARAERLKVQVSRKGLTVRARNLFDVRTIEDRNWAARLSDALVSPVPATGVTLRMTSYVAADPNGSGQLTLMLAGEASRLRPGPATYQVAVRNVEGGELVSTEQPLGEVADDRLPFSTNLSVAPGSYIVRFAVMDGTGRVGSVDHRVEARRVPVGSLTASGPLLVRVPGEPTAASRLTLDGVRQDERLALQVDLEADGERPADTDVVFEILADRSSTAQPSQLAAAPASALAMPFADRSANAQPGQRAAPANAGDSAIGSAPDGPVLVTTLAAISAGPGGRTILAQAIADLRVLPPGSYVARAKVKSGGAALGELRRGFVVIEAPAQLPAMTVTSAATTATTAAPRAMARAAARPATPTSVKARAMATAGSFEPAHLLEPGVVGAYLDRLAVRPDVSSTEARALLERARTTALNDLVVSDALAAEAPVAAPFLRGLTLLAQGKLDPAAQAFRTAMRAGSDFYPAMIYLGACYAAGGQHKEAAGAWRTALIREGDSVRVHLLLADALLRTGRGDLAMQALTRARTRWPDDEALTRRYAAAAIATGLYTQGLDVLDGLIERRADDEPVLALGLLVLYDAFVIGRPIETPERDRARMTHYADTYRARGGPSLALLDTWMADIEKRTR